MPHFQDFSGRLAGCDRPETLPATIAHALVCGHCWGAAGKPEPLMAPVLLADCDWCRYERMCYDIAPRVGERCPVHRLPYDVDNRCWCCFLDVEAGRVLELVCPV